MIFAAVSTVGLICVHSVSYRFGIDLFTQERQLSGNPTRSTAEEGEGFLNSLSFLPLETSCQPLRLPPRYRYAIPRAASFSLMLRMLTSRRWKMPAASAASAPVFSKTSRKWSALPAPLEAITGIRTRPLT